MKSGADALRKQRRKVLVLLKRDDFLILFYFIAAIDTRKPHAKGRITQVVQAAAQPTHSEQPNTTAMDQYCFLLTGSD